MKPSLALTDAANPLPPINIEAEQSLLGALFLGGTDSVESVLDVLRPDDFFRHAHRLIFEAMTSVCNRGRVMDPIVLKDELERRGALEDAGGLVYLLQLGDIVPSVASMPHYLCIVRSQSLRRRIHAVATEIRTIACASEIDATTLADTAVRLVDEATQVHQQMPETRTMATVVSETLAMIEDAMRRGGGLAGMPTGLTKYDRIVGGYQSGQLHIVAGRSGMGKSVFASTVALNVAQAGGCVAYFTGEMPDTQVNQRMIAATLRVPLEDVINGTFTDSQYAALCQRTSKELAMLPIRFDDSSTVTCSQIAARCRRFRRELGGLDLVIVDYLQRVTPDTTRKGGTKAEEIAEIARSLKTFARDFGVPVLALAQPNRNVDHREDKRPTVADLADSSAIEKEADTVALLYRPGYYERKTSGMEDPEYEEVEIILGKNRAGRMGMVKALFSGRYQRFDNLAEVEDQF